MIDDGTHAGNDSEETTQDMARRISVIYKYPLETDSGGLVAISGTAVIPLWVDMQWEQLMLWARHDIDDSDSGDLEQVFDVKVSPQPLPKGYVALNTVQLPTGNIVNTGYRKE